MWLLLWLECVGCDECEECEVTEFGMLDVVESAAGAAMARAAMAAKRAMVKRMLMVWVYVVVLREKVVCGEVELVKSA